MVILPALSACALMIPIAAWKDTRNIWSFSLITTIITFGVSLVMVFNFKWSAPGMQFGAEPRGSRR